MFDDDLTHQLPFAPPRVLVCNARSLFTQPCWELLRNAISLGSNDIIGATETRTLQDIMAKFIRPFSHMIYSCYDKTRPNESRCPVIIQTSLSSQVRKVWYHPGYATCLLLNAPIPLLIISLYLTHSSTRNSSFTLDKICNFLSPILIRANSAAWRTFVGGDFNSSPLDELIDPAHSNKSRSRPHQVNTLLQRNNIYDIWRWSYPDVSGSTYTHKSPGTHSRLDYTYVLSTLLQKMTCNKLLDCK
jgi:hypothetical protein